ncbi:MAG: type II secretion system protein [Methylobacter sp.]|nr:type II secretion system protein [Methylococcales bacterium]MDD5113284.1 type II secretion system protein [Methylobacter sp.]
MNLNKQQGFTMIELIMVIVILGILAATALPKFVDLGKDARAASVNAAKGALSSVAAMAHGKYLVSATPPASIVAEGVTITFSTAFASGYPKADASLAAAAGLSASDYTITASSTANTLTISPISAPTATASSCSVVYAEPTSATAAPVLTVTVTGC